MASISRYEVVHPEEAYDRYDSAVRRGEAVEYDLINEEGVIHVSLTNITFAQEDDFWRLIGTTEDHRTVNIVFEQRNGDKMVAVQATM